MKDEKEYYFFFSINDASLKFSCAESIIRSALNRKGTSKGYRWYDLKDEEYEKLLQGSETIESIVKRNLNE